MAALIDAGVPVDAMGAEGNTALHLAAYHKQEGVVAVLMRAGERVLFNRTSSPMWSGSLLASPCHCA